MVNFKLGCRIKDGVKFIYHVRAGAKENLGVPERTNP